MTDNEITKALEYCSNPNNTCEKCVLYVADDDSCECASKLRLAALDLINRQKAEIEMLRTSINVDLENYASEYDSKIKAEAIKEFAERLKKEMSFGRYIQYDQIDNLVKEMVGDA